MEQLEVIMTGYSILVALSIARLLDGLRPAFKADARYFVHTLWLLNKLINVLVVYWATWYFTGDAISFAQFLIILTPPAIVYLQVDALLSKKPEEVEDWRAHFYANHRFLFMANFALGLSLLAQILWASNKSYPPQVFFLLGMLSLVSLVGAWSKSHRVHVAIVALAFLNLTAGFTAQLTTLSID